MEEPAELTDRILAGERSGTARSSEAPPNAGAGPVALLLHPFRAVVLRLLAPALAVVVLSVVAQGGFVLVLAAALVGGLGLLLCPWPARTWGIGLLLGCATVLVLLLSSYE